MKCMVCGGQCEHLGRLGSLDHFRCRQCGMIQNRRNKKEDKKREER